MEFGYGIHALNPKNPVSIFLYQKLMRPYTSIRS